MINLKVSDQPGEVWEYIPNTNNKYKISNHGRIKQLIESEIDSNSNYIPDHEILLYCASFKQMNVVPIMFVYEDGTKEFKGVNPKDILLQVFPEECDTEDIPLLEGEIWKPVPEYEDKYMVSNKGRLKSIDHVCVAADGKTYFKKGKILKVPIDSRGYRSVVINAGLDENGKRIVKTLTVHRLVAQLFHPNPENKEQVNHIDGIKTNNDVTNLEWNTPKENVQHAFRTGLAHAKQGVEANRAKIKNDDDIERLKDMYFSGKSADDVGAEFGISGTEVIDIIRGNRFKSHFSQEEYDRRMATRVVENKQVGTSHPRCKADAARIQEALELYKSGMQIKDIAKKYGVDRHAVSRWLHSKWGAGVAANAQAGMSHSQTKVTPELYRKACEMRDQGFTPNYIGNKLGFNRNTIVKWFTHDWYKDLLKDDDSVQ